MSAEPTKIKNQKLELVRGKIKLSMPALGKIKLINILEQSGDDSPDKYYTPMTPMTPMTPITPDIQGSLFGGNKFSFFMMAEQNFVKNAFSEKYDVFQKLGQGANGVVKRCQCKLTRQMFAVKTGSMEDEHAISLKKIVETMRSIKHPNILRMKQLYLDSKRSTYYQVMDYLPHPSLKHLITHSSKTIRPKIHKIMKQLFEALEYLHQHHIVHRDIKTENLLYDENNEMLYVIDLGLITKTVQRGRRRNLWSNTGTLQYKAPETLEGSYNESIDAWAAGVVLFELVEGVTPFRQETHMDIIQNIQQINYRFTPDLWRDIPLAKLLVTRLLKPKNQRLSSKTALQDPWLQLMCSSNPSSPLVRFKLLNSISVPQASSIFSNSVDKQSEQDGQLVPQIKCNNYFGRIASYDSPNSSLYSKHISFEEMERMLGRYQDTDIINNNS